MPELPRGSYERVLIHDNFRALELFAKRHRCGIVAFRGLKTFNGRFIVFHVKGVTLISTGMGSAQTNSLVESLARHGCRAIIKVGTCSALDSRLREGDVIVPSGALIDEGATSWRRVKNQNDLGFFNTEVSVDRYIRNLEVVCANEELRKKMVQKCRKRKIRYRNRLSDQYVWSVDAYDCFDSSVRLYSKVNKKQYILREFLSGSIFSVLLLGVEMECSSLFSSAQAMGISAAAMVVVSRTLARLIASNTSPQEQIYYNIHAHLPERDTSDIQKSELKCIETSLEVLENW